MSKFYGSDINKIPPEFLLLATPFSNENRINFSSRLGVDEFFSGLYVDSKSEIKENTFFDQKVAAALKDAENPFSKVDLIQISGYAGCGKTTFVRHLILNAFGMTALSKNLIDFEGETDIPELYRGVLAQKMLCDINEGSPNLTLMQDINRLHLSTFGANTVHALQNVIQKMNNIEEPDGSKLKRILREQRASFKNDEEYIYGLLTFYFLWEFSAHISSNSEKATIVILFDNVDSISDIGQEKTFVLTLKNFINSCNYFFGYNIDNSKSYGTGKIADGMRKIKFVCFLTTRFITAQRMRELVPDCEETYGWHGISMPHQYYDHADIIRKRVLYYKELEGENNSITIKRLEGILELSDNMYRSNFFQSLFNGNLRFCIRTICELERSHGYSALVDESNQIFRRSLSEIELKRELTEGATGILLNILLNYLKGQDVYSEKLHLSECQQDGKISLSRIILTILHEKGGRCILSELILLLKPLFAIEEICATIYDLSEAKRDIMRRMITCDVILSDTKQQFVERGKSGDSSFEHGELQLCLSGETFLSSIVPHFEFMLSRHISNSTFIGDYGYYPLFSQSSERKVGGSSTVFVYAFERKIDAVYKDVEDCCRNSVLFSEQAMNALQLSRNLYLNSSYLNYRTISKDGAVGFRQSYESRLIFGHIGYIERYRRYLLHKHQHADQKFLQGINERLVVRINRYLQLYRNQDLCFGTPPQDKAAKYLEEEIEVIRVSGYNDITTKIEISYS